MAVSAERQEYERAMELRDQIAALEGGLRERQHVDRQKTYNEDIVNYIVSEGTVFLMLFNVDRGTLSGGSASIPSTRRRGSWRSSSPATTPTTNRHRR